MVCYPCARAAARGAVTGPREARLDCLALERGSLARAARLPRFSEAVAEPRDAREPDRSQIIDETRVGPLRSTLGLKNECDFENRKCIHF